MEWLLWIFGLLAVLAVAVAIVATFSSGGQQQHGRAGNRRTSLRQWLL